LTRWRIAAATDTGLVREVNEDTVYADDLLAVVADGMGGHAAGEVASIIATDAVRDVFHADSTVGGLEAAIQAANRAILADAREHPDRFGMGTTAIAVGLTHDETGVVFPTLVNVGDSRAYQIRDGALRQLSEDHSVAEEWVRMGRLTPDEALVHPRRHQLTRTLGVEDEVEVDIQSIAAMPGDRILLCSDGLSNELSAETLADLAGAEEPLDVIVGRLVAAAREAGGRDNISVILLEFEEVEAAPTPFRRTVGNTPAPRAPTSSAAIGRSRRRASRFTWRVVAALVVLLAVAGGGVAIVHWYAYSTYYVAVDAAALPEPVIAIYQGQPNGVLWYKPIKVTDTSYLVKNLTPSDAALLATNPTEPSEADALSVAHAFFQHWKDSQPIQPATTTTLTGQG
jgi:PPM family protein phosphatase